MIRGRRSFLQVICGLLAWVGARPALYASSADRQADFLAEAERMRRQAVGAGDQPYGAVLVLDKTIVGYGPSRVVVDRNPNAHAERVAIWAAQKALGRKDLTGAVLYSTSRPCSACETVAAEANVARMIYGEGVDAGQPRRRN
jgi:tRNA(Arg) A34 adenosine deaminase TadA